MGANQSGQRAPRSDTGTLVLHNPALTPQTKEDKFFIDTRGQNLHLVHLFAKEQGKGYGTRIIQHLVEEFDRQQLTGTITMHMSTSYGSPLLFFLYMGMMPDPEHTREDYYLDLHYPDDRLPINSLTRSALLKIASLDEKDWGIIFRDQGSEICVSKKHKQYTYNQIKDKLKFVIHKEKQIGESIADITDEMLISHKDFLLGLKDKIIPYLSASFIPTLLDILNSHLAEKYPDTNAMGSFNLCMSPEGFKRWRETIEDNQPFQPFKNLEHLIPHIHPDYKEWLEAEIATTMEKRNNALAAVNTNTFSNIKCT